MLNLPNTVTHALNRSLLLLTLTAGCTARTPGKTVSGAGLPVSPISGVRSFSETVPITSLTSLGGKIYAGTPAGLIRFDLQSRDHVRLTSAEGLSGDHVHALSGNPGSGLWVATDKGISSYKSGVWKNHPVGQPPGEMVTAMVAATWGVWAGGPHGLGRYKNGKWKGFLPGAQVTTLISDLSGEGVWVGTAGEGLYQFENGKFKSHNPARGQRVRHVKSMAYTRDSGLVVVGKGKEGDLLSYFDGTNWITYTLEPAGRLRWIHQVGSETLMNFDDRILVLERMQGVDPRGKKIPTPVGPVVLTPSVSPGAPSDYPAPILYTRILERWLPPNPTIVVGHGKGVIIGTETTGVVRFDGERAVWYQTGNLLGDAEKLRVGCAGGACYVAGGAGKAYRFDGEKFSAIQVTEDGGARVLSMLNDASGAVVSIHSPADGQSLVVSKMSPDGKFKRQFESKITIPSGRVEVRFSRFAPGGKLWVGLAYREEEGEQIPWGVAALGSAGSVLYHRSNLLPTEDRQKGSLALPDDIRDVLFFKSDIWFATGAGACRVQGAKVDLFTENDGLASELTHAFLGTPAGEVLLASHGGVGRFDGKRWRFDFEGPLNGSVRALTRDGNTLWVGTSRGLIRRAAKGQFLQISSKHGLAGDVVLDLFIDPKRRMWILTQQGLSIINLK